MNDELTTWTLLSEVPRKRLSEPVVRDVISTSYDTDTRSMAGTPLELTGSDAKTLNIGRAVIGSSADLTGVTVKKLKDFHCSRSVSFGSFKV